MKEEILERFWRHREATEKEIRRRGSRIRQATNEAEDPYVKRVLGWASENWNLIEMLAGEDEETTITGKESTGLLKATMMLIPDDLKADLKRERIMGIVDRELTAEDRERLEVTMLLGEEKRRFGTPCPETEERLRELNRSRAARRGGPPITVEGLNEMNRRIVNIFRVDDPLDLPHEDSQNKPLL